MVIELKNCFLSLAYKEISILSHSFSKRTTLDAFRYNHHIKIGNFITRVACMKIFESLLSPICELEKKHDIKLDNEPILTIEYAEYNPYKSEEDNSKFVMSLEIGYSSTLFNINLITIIENIIFEILNEHN